MSTYLYVLLSLFSAWSHPLASATRLPTLSDLSTFVALRSCLLTLQSRRDFTFLSTFHEHFTSKPLRNIRNVCLASVVEFFLNVAPNRSQIRSDISASGSTTHHHRTSRRRT